MKAPEDRIQRWGEQDAGAGALPERAAGLAAAARNVPPLDAVALARIKRGALAPSARRGFARLALTTRVAIAGVLLLGSAATATGTVVLWKRHAARGAAPAPAPREISRAHRPRATAPRQTPPPASAIEPEVAPAPPAEIASLPAPEPRPQPRARAIARAEPHPAAGAAHAIEPPRAAFDQPDAPAGATATEARLLARVIERLRQGRDPRGAIALLDDYARAHPHGVLEAEALLARLEATLALGDRTTALALLDGRAGFSGRLGADLLLTRAELRASSDRYAEAVGDFDELLRRRTPAMTGDAEERALYGRAVSLGHLGQDARARTDLLAYRRRFPAGRFAVEVNRLLTQVP